MKTETILSLLPLFGLLVWAAVVDARVRRIRNWLTLSLILSGLLHNATGTTTGSLGSAGLGLLVGFALTVGLFVLGAIGGGDVKLLAGVGAWVGAAAVFRVFCAEAVIGMVIVLAQAAVAGRLRLLCRNSVLLTLNVLHVSELGLDHTTATGHACRSVDRPLPYAVPVLLAVVALAIVGGL